MAHGILCQHCDELIELDALIAVFVELFDNFVDVLRGQFDVEFFEDRGYFLGGGGVPLCLFCRCRPCRTGRRPS